MCIICLKPAGVDLPSDEEIKYMFQRNPHGAGFALQGDIRKDGVFRVEYHKGFMNVDDLIEALGPREKLKDLTVAIHCRIKTSGETDKFTTHPFPISNQYADLRALDGEGPVLFHNGVFTGLGGLADPKSSDTQDYVIGIASRFMSNAKMPGKVAQGIIGQITGSCRVLILYPKATFPMLRLGDWYEHNGCWYSNMGYKQETTVSTSRYDYYHNTYSEKKNWRTELDEWGCNIADYAWPSDEDDWIRFLDEDRWNRIAEQYTSKEEKEGEIFVTYASTGNKKWILDEENHQIYTPARREDVKLRQDEEDYILDATEYGSIYSEKGYMWFEDDQVLLTWMENAKKLEEFVYKFQGQIWYVDTVNCEAYTEEGIKNYFKPGEVGHVRKELKTKGFYMHHDRNAQFDVPDDEDDVSAFLGYGSNDWYEGA